MSMEAKECFSEPACAKNNALHYQTTLPQHPAAPISTHAKGSMHCMHISSRTLQKVAKKWHLSHVLNPWEGLDP